MELTRPMMAELCIHIPFKQLKDIKLLGYEWIYFVVPSKNHWEAVLIRRSRSNLTIASKRPFDLCESWSKPCCANASFDLVEQHMRRLYKRSLSSGDWVNAGHTRANPVAEPSIKCKEEPPELVRSLIEECGHQLRFEPMEAVIGTNAAIQVALEKFNRGMAILASWDNGNGDPFGGASIGEPEMNDIWSSRGDLKKLGDVLYGKEHGCPPSANNLSWTWGFLGRCTRILQRRRLRIHVPLDGGSYKWQERSVSRMNRIVNKLAVEVGAMALLFYSSYSTINYKWHEAGGYEEYADEIDHGIIQGILANTLTIPENFCLFNPFAYLSWILDENYVQICNELGVENLSSLGTCIGDGPPREVPLNVALELLPPGSNWSRMHHGGRVRLVSKEDWNLGSKRPKVLLGDHSDYLGTLGFDPYTDEGLELLFTPGFG
ncbi:hypothetical protein F5Y13DRAFT_153379 [Hypoxylon sp. FL1857]|nr:hypothetical protein F5Y13DRAFT_153379 [Hypoxylon sp. FL1857]